MAKRGRPRHPDILTPREWEVLALLREELSNEQIADRLGTTERTARFHVSEILSKLGVSSRQEAAEWEPEERRAWVVLPWPRPFRLANAVLIGVAAVGVAAIVALVWALLATRGGSSASVPVQARAATATIDLPPIDRVMIALDDEAIVRSDTNGLVTLFDASNGDVLGQVKAGYTPDALLRRSKGELLVSQAFGGEISQSVPRTDSPSLVIYGLGDLSTPLAIIDLPGRPTYIVWTPYAVLSASARYLYYPAIDQEATNDKCPPGGEVSVCQVWQVGIVDLELRKLVAQAELGENCGPRIQPDGSSDALVICQDIRSRQSSIPFVPDGVRLFRITPDGQSEQVAAFPARRKSDQVFSAMYAGTKADGQRYVLYSDGALFIEGNAEPAEDLLPNDSDRLGFNAGISLGQNRDGFLFGDRFDGQYRGLLVFDSLSPTVAQSFVLPALVEHAAPLDDGHVALLIVGGATMQMFDLQSGKVDGGIPLPEGTKWLIGE